MSEGARIPVALAESIATFTDALLAERGQSPRTAESYGRDLAAFARFLAARGRVSPEGVTRADMTDFLASERELGLKGTTRARRAIALKMWFRFLAETRRVGSDPSRLVETPKKGRTLPRVLSEAETAAMIDAIGGEDPRSLRDRAMLELLYGCGLRVSELVALKADDFVADGELLRIFGKGSKERLVPVGVCAGKAVTDYLAKGRAAFAAGRATATHLFLTRLGGAFTRQGVNKIVRERAEAVGIAASRVSPHVLRHSYASHMLAHGADIRSIQELLGHADIATTQIYTHVDDARFRETHALHPRH